MNRFGTAYRDAIASIRQMRNVNTPFSIQNVKSESLKRKGGFSKSSLPKKPKPSSWTHKFVCLANTDDDRVPTSLYAKESLTFAGLGEKKIVIPDVDCTTEEFHEVLISSFPQLRNAGGFELMRCLPSSRDLEIIPSPICHSPRLLRSRISTARVYIRPIQNNLEMEIFSLQDNEVCFDFIILSTYVHVG